MSRSILSDISDAHAASVFRDSISRRRALALLGGALAAPALLGRASAATPDSWWRNLPLARDLIGAAVPSSTGLLIDLPYLSEDGTSVPMGIAIENPTSPDAYVASLHCFAPANPSQQIGEYHFSPRNGRAEIATRIRLNESQTVGAIAIMSTGEVRVAQRDVKVFTIGCFTNAASYATDHLMLARVRLAEPVVAGRPVEVTTLINHPMETGLRTDLAGAIVPRAMVERFVASYGRATIFDARFHGSVAVNPYLRFFFVPDAPGDLALRWEDNTGRVTEQRIPVLIA